MATATPQVAQDAAAADRFAANVDRNTVSVPEARRAAHDHVARRTGATCQCSNDSSARLLLVSDLTGHDVDLVDEIETLTETFFVKASCDKRKVSTLDDLGSFLANRASQCELLLTNEVIGQLSDRVLGGDIVARQHTNAEIRAAASRHCVDPRVIGCVELERFFDMEGIHADHLIAANTVVAAIDRYVAHVVDPLIDDNEPAAFRRQRRELALAVGSNERNMPPFVLPTRATLVRHIDDAATTEMDRALHDTLRLALDARSEHDRQEKRRRNGLVLCREVYRAVWQHGRYISTEMDNDDNVYHLQLRFNSASRQATRPLDRALVGQLCDQVPGSVVSLLPPAASEKTASTTFRSMLEVTQYIVGRRHLNKLPHMNQLSADVVEAIETFTGVHYSTTIAAIAADLGYQLPMSSNEATCLTLLKDAFADMGQVADIVYDRVPNIAAWRGSQLRPDFLVSFQTPGCLPGFETRETVIVEADGEGHFVDVHNWSLEAARRRDAEKAALIFDAADSGERIRMLAFHHAALRALDAEQMRSLLEAMTSQGWTWVFVAPEGSSDRRAVDAHTHSVTLPGFDGFDVFVATRHCVYN